MSDCAPIADGLRRNFTYVNTFLDREPKFDILAPEPSDLGAYDFVVCSEVLEHVPPPAHRAFTNLARILRPGGCVVFSVPWVPDGDTHEHYPELFQWKTFEFNGGHILVNRTQSGCLQVFDSPVFHGGPGQTLEMRVFSRSGLTSSLEAAGFRHLQFAKTEANREYGILLEPWSRGLVARL